MAAIHSTAIVAPGAQIADDAAIGPYCIIGPHVRIGPGTKLLSHVNVDGHTTIGSGCVIWPFASIGTQTQDLKFKGGAPRVEIGDNNTIREYVTINAATNDGGVTRVGSGCHIMATAHIAHDCIVGDKVIIANAGTLAGHVIVEDQVIIGGLCGVHQFARLGRLCIIGGCSKVVMDIPPYMMADGTPIGVHTINAVGLKRAGVPDSTQQTLKKAFKILYRKNLTTAKAVEEMVGTLEQTPEIQHLVAFIQGSERGITR